MTLPPDFLEDILRVNLVLSQQTFRSLKLDRFLKSILAMCIAIQPDWQNTFCKHALTRRFISYEIESDDMLQAMILDLGSLASTDNIATQNNLIVDADFDIVLADIWLRHAFSLLTRAIKYGSVHIGTRIIKHITSLSGWVPDFKAITTTSHTATLSSRNVTKTMYVIYNLSEDKNILGKLRTYLALKDWIKFIIDNDMLPDGTFSNKLSWFTYFDFHKMEKLCDEPWYHIIKPFMPYVHFYDIIHHFGEHNNISKVADCLFECVTNIEHWFLIEKQCVLCYFLYGLPTACKKARKDEVAKIKYVAYHLLAEKKFKHTDTRCECPKTHVYLNNVRKWLDLDLEFRVIPQEERYYYLNFGMKLPDDKKI